MNAGPSETALPRRIRVATFAVVLLALLLRLLFVHEAVIDRPLSGDSRQYVAYAHNLNEYATFSHSVPGHPLAADAYRGPGYPLFLATCMRLIGGGLEGPWYALAMLMQCLLGAASVWLTILLGRRWLPSWACVAAGALLAVWPHHVVASDALLTEVLLGFLLLLALQCAVLAQERNRARWALSAGACLGYATLVNPVVSLLAPLLALALMRDRGPRLLAPLLLLPVLCWAGWALREARLPAQKEPGRAALNLVQGSWPIYHTAWQLGAYDPVAAGITRQIDAEGAAMSEHPAAGLAAMARRLAGSPGYYLHWYLLEKPYLLWDWDIRVGSGDVYVKQVADSPFERYPVLNATKSALRALNPMLYLLALSQAAWLGWCWLLRRPPLPPAATMVALAFAYFSVLHNVFQAEPRYSIAYRPEEFLLSMAAIAAALAWLSKRRAAKPSPAVA